MPTTPRSCEVCGRDITSKRAGARTCCTRHRKALSRAEQARTTPGKEHDGR